MWRMGARKKDEQIMIIEWQKLLTQNEVPQHKWPLAVEEVVSKNPHQKLESPKPRKATVVTYPSGLPVTIHNPATGKNEWNPEMSFGLELIYKAYKSSWGTLCAPAWSRTDNSVHFHSV
jgi:hypothetical protein